jgi:hypothetical protein
MSNSLEKIDNEDGEIYMGELAIRIYNAAIEAAAKEVEEWDKGMSPKSDIAPEIRKLKK